MATACQDFCTTGLPTGCRPKGMSASRQCPQLPVTHEGNEGENPPEDREGIIRREDVVGNGEVVEPGSQAKPVGIREEVKQVPVEQRAAPHTDSVPMYPG